jgi:cyclopropane-fatty-acyl-phospholipid synthase
MNPVPVPAREPQSGQHVATARSAAWEARSLHPPGSLRLQWSIVLQGVVLWPAQAVAPFYFSWDALAVTLVLWWLTACLGISLGYHRLLSHASFKTSRALKYTFTVLGMLANQGPPIVWVGTHRLHHRHPDEPGDPHTPLHSFWWAQYFWVFWFPHDKARDAARDLARDPGLVFLDRCYFLPQLLLIGALYLFGGLPWVLWGFFVRMGLMLIFTNLVNSAAHRWGYRNFETCDRSRNSWWVALLTYGEGWHNNHHAMPRSARHGLRWWEIDLTYLTIQALAAVGLARDVRLPMPEHIARLDVRRKAPWRYGRQAVSHGFLYAAIQQALDSDGLLDPEETWQYWAQSSNPARNWLARTWPPAGRRKAVLRDMMTRDHASGIEAHYDISNAFYRLWLDREYMFYSCAKFDSPTDSLQQAQRNKAAFLLSILDPKPGEKILDLGCGWGGMLKAIFGQTHDRKNLLGLSLSRPQVTFIREELQLRSDYANFITKDYPPGCCDKICTVGSMEHVRPNEIESVHSKWFRALPRGGRIVHQFFSTDCNPHSTYMIALQHFFPGTMLSRHDRIVSAIRRAGFRIELDVTDDYRPTLRAWFDNLVANKDAAVSLVGVHGFNKYLVFFPASWRFFADRQARLHRMLLVKD